MVLGRPQSAMDESKGKKKKKRDEGRRNKRSFSFEKRVGWLGIFSKILYFTFISCIMCPSRGVQILTLRMDASQVLYHIFNVAIQMNGPHTLQRRFNTFKAPYYLISEYLIHLQIRISTKIGTVEWSALGRHRSPNTPTLKP